MTLPPLDRIASSAGGLTACCLLVHALGWFFTPHYDIWIFFHDMARAVILTFLGLSCVIAEFAPNTYPPYQMLSEILPFLFLKKAQGLKSRGMFYILVGCEMMGAYNRLVPSGGWGWFCILSGILGFFTGLGCILLGFQYNLLEQQAALMTPFDGPVTTQPFQNVENGPSQPKPDQQYNDQLQQHPGRDPQFREGHNPGNYNQSNDPPIQFDGLRNPYDDAADRYQREREARSPQIRQEIAPQGQQTPDRYAQPYEPSQDVAPRDISLRNEREEAEHFRDSKSSFSNERTRDDTIRSSFDRSAGEAAFDRSPREDFAPPDRADC